MGQIRVQGGVLVGALVSGALATGMLGGAPTANATCASFFGIGNSADCSSTLLSGAIAIGTGATAHATGLFGAAFSTGTKAEAFTANAFTFATAVGDSAEADAEGIFGIATQLGANGFTQTFSPGNVGLNIAIGVSPGNTVFFGSVAEALGVGNVAVNLFGNGTTPDGNVVRAIGFVNVAANLGGDNNKVQARPFGPNQTAVLNLAFNAFGSGNTVKAGPGPVAIAGSIAQTGATVTKVGPGFNINGIRVPNTAAAGGGTKTSAPTATAVRTGQKNAAPAAARVGHKK